MAMKIRLTRMGSKKRPFYRVVALNGATRRDGRPAEYLGHYNPMVEPEEIQLAEPSDTVRSLLKKAGK